MNSEKRRDKNNRLFFKIKKYLVHIFLSQFLLYFGLKKKKKNGQTWNIKSSIA